jgi:hypothetical protein
VTDGSVVARLARLAGFALVAAAAGVLAACSDGTTPTCPQTDGGCSYVPVESGAYGDGGAADVAQANETGAPDGSE